MSGKFIEKVLALGISGDTTQLRQDLNKMYRTLAQVKEPFEQVTRVAKFLGVALEDGRYQTQQITDAMKKLEVSADSQNKKLQALRKTYTELFDPNRAAGLKRQAFFAGIDDQQAGGRDALAERLAAFKKEKAEQEKVAAATAKTLAAEAEVARKKAESLALAKQQAQWEANRAAGLREQARLAEYERSAQQGALALEERRAKLAKMRAEDEERVAAAIQRVNDRLRFRQQLQDAIAKDAADRMAQGDRSRAMTGNRLAALGSSDPWFSVGPVQAAAAARAAERQAFLDSQKSSKQLELERLTSLQQRGIITTNEFAAAQRRLRFEMSVLGQAINSTATAIGTLLGPLVLVYQTYQAFTFAIRKTAELDEARAKFRAFTGDVEKANKVLADLRQFSLENPVKFGAASGAVATMLQFGVSSGTVLQDFKAIATITGGVTERMDKLALAFAQSSAAGKLMGQELIQMVNAGFNPLQIISEQSGKSMAQLRDEMSKGQISFDMVRQAFQDAVGEGGKFNGLLGELANTTAGKLTRMESAFEALGISFGELIQPEVNASLEGAASLLQDIAATLKTMKDIRETIFPTEASLDPAMKSRVSEYDRRQQEYLAAQANVKAVALKAEQGGTLNSAEQFFLKRGQEQLRNYKANSDAIFRIDLDRYQKQLAAAKDFATQQQLFIKFVERQGRGQFNDQDIATYLRWKKELEDAEARSERFAKAQQTVSEAVADVNAELQDNINKLRFGADTTEAMNVFRGMLPGNVAAAFDEMVAKAKSLADINVTDLFDAAGFAPETIKLIEDAMAKLVAKQKELADLKAKDDAAKEKTKLDEAIKKQLDELKSKVQFERESLALTKEQARIRQLMRDDKMTKAQAEEVAQGERALAAFEKLRDLQDKAKSLTSEFAPGGKLVEDLGQLLAMQQRGLIDNGTFTKARNKLLGEAAGSSNVDGLPPALRQGTQEAYKQMVAGRASEMQTLIDEVRRQRMAAEAMPRAQAEANRLLRDIADNAIGNAG